MYDSGCPLNFNHAVFLILRHATTHHGSFYHTYAPARRLNANYIFNHFSSYSYTAKGRLAPVRYVSLPYRPYTAVANDEHGNQIWLTTSRTLREVVLDVKSNLPVSRLQSRPETIPETHLMYLSSFSMAGKQLVVYPELRLIR